MNLITPPPPAKPLYEALGVRESATAEEIRDAYLRLAMRHHPDVNAGADDVFMRAKEAYELLRDPALRREYDRTGVDPRAAFVGIGRDALKRLFSATVEVIGKHGSDVDIIAAVRDLLRNEIQAAQAAVVTIEAAQERARLAADNIEKRWSGATLVRDRLVATIRTAICQETSQKDEQERVISVAEAALRLLADAHYDMPMERPLGGNIYAPSRGWNSLLKRGYRRNGDSQPVT